MASTGYALAASLAFGVADFFGGLKSRTAPLLTVLAVSQAAGLATVAVAVAAAGKGPPGEGSLLWGALAGVLGLATLAVFYRAMAVGVMSIVSPVTSTGPIVPLAFGVLIGERVSGRQWAGVALALGGVVLCASRATVTAGAPAGLRAGLGLALVGAAGLGPFLSALGAASKEDPLWASLVQRGTSAALVIALVLVLGTPRPRGPVAAGQLVALGILDMCGGILFALAADEGLVGISAVLASLYPVVTVVLGHAVLGERLALSQWAGVALVLAGVPLAARG